jgi:predicted nucleic acid-binding Zn ribbon protein
MRRRAPRPIALAVKAVAESLAPATQLAEIQRIWAQIAGPAIAREAQPAGVREGVLTVSCQASVWAHELELMGPQLAGRLNAALGSEVVRSVRCRADRTGAAR